VGSAEEIADELQSWVEDTDIDGFNLSRVITPEGLEDFVDLVVPLLQERGVYKRDYTEGTLREKLFGPGRARLETNHPGASFRTLGSSAAPSQTIIPAAE
jgi:long-chain alkane monooxygenase